MTDRAGSEQRGDPNGADDLRKAYRGRARGPWIVAAALAVP